MVMGEFNFQAWIDSDVQTIASHFRVEKIKGLFLCVLSTYCAPGPMLEHPPPPFAHGQVGRLKARPQRPELHSTGDL